MLDDYEFYRVDSGDATTNRDVDESSDREPLAEATQDFVEENERALLEIVATSDDRVRRAQAWALLSRADTDVDTSGLDALLEG